LAGDWIPMRVLLSRDPKVIAMADQLRGRPGFTAWALGRDIGCDMSRDIRVTRSVTVCVTVTALLQVWGVGREQGRQAEDDLIIDRIGLDVLDEMAAVPGFGEAMAHVGWAVGLPGGGVTFPKFFVQNMPTAELRRRRAADRKQRQRDKQRDKQRDMSRSPPRDSHADSHAECPGKGKERTEEAKEGEAAPRDGPLQPPDPPAAAPLDGDDGWLVREWFLVYRGPAKPGLHAEVGRMLNELRRLGWSPEALKAQIHAESRSKTEWPSTFSARLERQIKQRAGGSPKPATPSMSEMMRALESQKRKEAAGDG
jgi:hypothetical protein